MEKISKYLPWVLGGVLLLNLLILDFVWVSGQKKSTTSQAEISPLAIPTETNLEPTLAPQVAEITSCPSACKEYVQAEMAKLVIPTPKSSEGKTASAAKVVYLPIGCSGTTANASWTDISGCDFYLDMANYPSVKSVSWEISLQSYQSTNPAYIRLYDVTGKRAVDASELSTNSSTYEYLRSGNLTIWAGNNLYRIQAKASAANTVNFISPRLKITLE